MLYGVKPESSGARANIDLGRVDEFVDTYLSKIDNPLKFKFAKKKESQLKRVMRLNSLRNADANVDFWDIKDLAGKKQNLIYGRAIFAYHADSINGYKAYLENVDVYDFLIDPSGGGLDMEKAKNMGRYGVVKDRYELKSNPSYIKAEVRKLLGDGDNTGTGNANELTQEETNKRNRHQAVETLTDVQIPDKDKFKFWEWYTTYQGERYYLLMQEAGVAIRVEKLTDIFPATKNFPLGAWPFWSYAKSPDLTEFWTPGRVDQVREIFMTQNVTVNQTVDNVEEYNKPMKVVDTTAIKNLSELTYRKGGYIKSSGIDISKALQVLRPDTIDTPIQLFNLLETIQEKASGLTDAAKGVSGDTKVGIYEGNQANAADRFGLTNKTYSFGTKRFAQLYEMGVRTHLTKKVAVELIGPDGIETEEVTKRDIFRKDDDFTVIVEASDAEDQASDTDKKNKIGFLAQAGANVAIAPVVNWKKAFEIGAHIAGFKDEEIKELLDTSEFGDAVMMSEAAHDIETILDGKPLQPNRAANLPYKQRFVDYMNDHENDMSHEQFMQLTAYIASCEPYVMKNTVRAMNVATANAGIAPPTQTPPGTTPVPPSNGTTPLQVPPAQNGTGIPIQG